MLEDGDPLRARLGAPRVAVLGPPAVGRPGGLHEVAVRPARILATLAGATRPQSADELAHAAWGDDLPATHRSALHVHLGTVRRTLEDHLPTCRVVRTAGGYELALGECELDASLASDLLERAREELDRAPSDALELARAGLGLWRGAPFTVAGEVVDPSSAQRYEALRRDGEELVVEALLQTGDAAAAEATARRGTEEEPYRERRWGQLLRARYLAGRTADALSTYQQARTVLVEDLGIEPGPELRDLEAAALLCDRARLRLPPVSTSALPAPPQAVGPLVARERDLHQISRALQEFGGVLVLGAPGVGKSRLAAEAARAASPEVAWIDLSRSEVPRDAEVLGAWSREHPGGTIVLDGAETDPRGIASTVAEIRHQSPSVGLLVTSRAPLDAPLAIHLLDPLTVPDVMADIEAIQASPAVQLLEASLRELAPSVELQPSQLAELARRGGGLPLALRLEARSARAIPVETLLARSASRDSVDAAIRDVVGLLDDDAAAAFAALSVLDGGFDTDLAGRVAGLPPDRTSELVPDLVDHGLVRAHAAGVNPYSMVAPIRAVGRELLDRRGDAREVRERLDDACLERASALHRAAMAGEVSDLTSRLEVDLPRHHQALAHLREAADAERALSLVSWLDAPLYVLGWWMEKIDLFDTALAIPGPDSVMRARALALRARPGPMHLFSLEHADAAMELASSLEHEPLRAFAQHLRSIGLWWNGEHEEAADTARAAADSLDRCGRRHESLEARKYLGVTLVASGDGEQGLAIQQAALEERRRDAGRFAVAHNLAYLGHCHRFLGDDIAAHTDWSEAIEHCRAIGNRGTAVHVAIGLAEIAVDRGDAAGALEWTGHALDLGHAARLETYTPWTWTVALRAHLELGDVDAARHCARRAVEGLAMAPSGEAVRLSGELARLALTTGDTVAAARLLGVADATTDRREIPLPSPAEARRMHDLDEQVRALGPAAQADREAGARCSVREAAGALLAA